VRVLRARLSAELFRDAPRQGPQLSGWEKGVLLGALLALAIVLQLARLGWSSSLNTIWAEDGHIFLQEAIVNGPLHALTATYGTYLVLAPRLIGELASLVPLKQAPAAIAILSAAAVALSGFVVWLASAAHIRSPYLRAALVAITILTPVSGVEAVDSAAYVLWYMLFASFWILLWRPTSWGGTILAAAFVLVTALSTPGVWFFAPLAALRAIAARDRRDVLIVCAYAAGALAQVPVVALSTEVVSAPVWSTHEIWTATMQRLVTETPLGLHLAGNGWKLLGWPLLAVVAAAGLATLVVGWRRAGPHARWIAGLAVPIALVMFVVSLYQRGVAEQMVWLSDTYNYLGSRYVIVPSLLLLSALFVLLDRRPQEQPSRPSTAHLRLALLAVLAVAVLSSFWVRDLVIRGAPWKQAVESAERECAAGGAEVLIPTSPPGWAVELPCTELTPGPS
jgi:hypothetical protein